MKECTLMAMRGRQKPFCGLRPMLMDSVGLVGSAYTRGSKRTSFSKICDCRGSSNTMIITIRMQIHES